MTTIELKLRAENETEDRIMDYLLENASDALAEKINAGDKTLAGALRYSKDQARKQEHNGVACIEDATVFGWVIHYFEEADLDEEEKPKASSTPEPASARKEHGHKPVRRPRKAREAKPDSETTETEEKPPKPQAEAPAPAPEPAPQTPAQPDLFSAPEKAGPE